MKGNEKTAMQGLQMFRIHIFLCNSDVLTWIYGVVKSLNF